MRTVVFRALAGLVAGLFGAILLVDPSRFSLREVIGGAVIAVGLGLHALLGSGLGERFIFTAFGGRSPDRKELPSECHNCEK